VVGGQLQPLAGIPLPRLPSGDSEPKDRVQSGIQAEEKSRKQRQNSLPIDDEEEILLNYIKRHYPEHVPAFSISVHTGIRAGEQFRMQWKDIDLKRRILTIPKTKNGSIRHIDLNETATAAVEWLYQRRTREPWVFLNSRGEQLRSQRDWFDRVLKATQLPDYTWHCNRHTFASRLVMKGVDLRTVGELLGHRTFQMTMRYAHLAADHKRSAVARLDKPGVASSFLIAESGG
jgi:integrase